MTIHKAVLLLCGCRVDPVTEDVYIACARHTCSPLMEFKEHPRCTFCASLHIKHSGIHFDCLDCGCRFPVSEAA